MSFERAFRSLSLRPSTICRQCKRTLASSAYKREQRSATASFADILQNSRNESASRPSRTPQRTSDPASAAAPPSLDSPPTRPQPSSYDLARAAVQDIGAAARRKQLEEQRSAENMSRTYQREDLERQVTRRWKVGDVYAPHDLTGVEMAKWKKLRRKGARGVKWDVVDQLGINPVDHYKNFSMMSEYMSEMGRIKHSNETALRPPNQRKMAKAIRRAIGIGLMPGVHRHPEILRIEIEARRSSYQ